MKEIEVKLYEVEPVTTIINSFNHIIEPLENYDLDTLRDVVTRLKQSDGEGWAVGEVVERILDFIEEKGEHHVDAELAAEAE